MKCTMEARFLALVLGLCFTPTVFAYGSDAGFVNRAGLPMSELSTASQPVVILCFNGYTVISEYTETVDAEGFFRGPIPASNGLRVRIDNTTLGLEDTPFSDREYASPNGYSEYIRFSPGTKHRTQSFTVRVPERGVTTNSFSFRIYKAASGEVVNTGTFQMDVSHEWLPERVSYQNSPVCGTFPPNPLPPSPLPPLPPRR